MCVSCRRRSRQAMKSRSPSGRTGSTHAGTRRAVRPQRQASERSLAIIVRHRAASPYQPRAADPRARLPVAGACVRRSQALHATTARSYRRGPLIEPAHARCLASQDCAWNRADPGVAGRQPPGHRARRRRHLSRTALPVALGSRPLITGTRWSGPLFFGLKERAKEASNG